MANILLIEDDALFLQALRRGLELNGHRTQSARDGLQGLERLVEDPPEVVLLDLNLGQEGLNGLQVLERIRELHADLPVIIMTGYGSIESAVEAMKLGACDYVQKPLNIEELLLIIERALEISRLRHEVGHLRVYRREQMAVEPVIAVSEQMRQVVEIASRVALSDAKTVLICGESGTGKDVIARLIHSKSGRSDGPYVVVNCGALPTDLVEIELFGCEKGAFPGAVEGRQGKFELADEGTLLLDEIDSMSLEGQTKLLRVLEDRKVCRLGSNWEIPIDVRFIATANRELGDLVEKGEFRRDLFYRLDLVGIHLPPLRERPDDILPLAEAFLKRLKRGHRERRIDPTARALLIGHEWPGNARELGNLLERIVLLDDPECIGPEHLDFSSTGREAVSKESGGAFIAPLIEQLPEGEVFALVMQRLLVEALKRTRGNQAEASRWLGLSKSRLAYRLRQYGIESKQYQDGREAGNGRTVD